MLRARSIAVLAVALSGDEPPREFRIFKAGWNDTDNGRFLFDEQAAAAVMAHYSAHGADRMIDLEHLSIDPDCANFDPDARGWAKLEVRGGELWAVDIKWTDDGASRLRNKTQRYISPVFTFDKNRRPTRLVNIALTALPATHGLDELVAARVQLESRPVVDWRKLATGVAFRDLQGMIANAIASLYPPPTLGDPAALTAGPWLVDVFDGSAVYELSGRLFEVAYSHDGTAVKLGTPAEVRRTYAPITVAQTRTQTRTARLSNGGTTMDAKLIKDALDAIESGDTNKALEILKGLIASAAGAPPSDLPADPALEGETAETVEAAAVRLLRATGRKSLSAALSTLDAYRQSHLELEERTETLALEQAKLETKERRTLVADLVKLGVEIPATAWANDKGSEPVKRLNDEPIDELRDRVAKLRAARGELPRTPEPPRRAAAASDSADVADLTDEELAKCKTSGVDPAKYARIRADIRARSQRNPPPADTH